jgi:hypothetical protein
MKRVSRPFGGKAEDLMFHALLLPLLTSGNVVVAIGAFMVWHKRAGLGEIVSTLRRSEPRP